MPIGMYGETPQVKIGQFTICRQNTDGDNNSVWIQSEGGEGGEFKDELFEKCILEFFDKHL